MSFRRILLGVLFLGLVAGISNANVIGYTYLIPKTSVAPLIDGLPDSVWKTVDWNFQTSYKNGTVVPDSTADLFGMHKLMWDDEFLYGYFYTQDSYIWDTHANSWERDAVEVYTDAGYQRVHAIDADDQHLSLRHEFIVDPAANIVNMGWSTGTVTEGTEVAMFDDTTSMGGWWLEFKIPLTALQISPIADTPIGLEWQQNDNDGANRESISKWWLQTGDDSYLYADRWGTGRLTDRAVSNMLEIKKVPPGSEPLIDGEMDAIYKYANPAPQNHYGNGPVFPDSIPDIYATTYLLWDDTNLYGFFDVWDNVIWDTHANSWERDAVEIYTDAGHERVHAIDVNDQHLSLRHEFIADPPANIVNMGWSTGTVTTGTELGIVDTDKGYTVEFKIPLTALQISPVEGTVIGLELQLNDNDGANRESVTKWWLPSGDDSYLYADRWGSAYLGSQLVVGIKPEPGVTINRFDLAQNYPNPFNPTTNIAYTLQKVGQVRLTVFDVTGREVAVLVNSTQTAGSHVATFKAAGLSSGVYFYQLKTADNVITKKMMIMK